MICEEPVRSPKVILENYRQAFVEVYKREPYARYVGNHWYDVNGETVHRSTLLGEIAHLQEIAQRQVVVRTEKSVVQRLIARLRGA